MNANYIKKCPISELRDIFAVLTDICADYSRMVDRYSLTTGDSTCDKMSAEMQEAMVERQRFFNYRDVVRLELQDRITGIMEGTNDR